MSGQGQSGPAHVAEGLDRVLAALGSPPVDALVAVTEHWGELVGPEASAASRPLAIEHGRLLVSVTEPAWASQLRWLEAEVVRRSADLLGPGVIDRLEPRVRWR